MNIPLRMLRASCLTLEINEFRCYEAKIEESESRTAEARDVLGSTPGDCRHFPLFSPHNI